jgi:Rad3-related DNA helicase
MNESPSIMLNEFLAFSQADLAGLTELQIAAVFRLAERQLDHREGLVKLEGRLAEEARQEAAEKDGALEKFYRSNDGVFVSPSSHEGLDLFDDRSRFQIIGKIPFASKGDKRVRQRMETDRGWYNLHTSQKLIQAFGRSIRSDTDYAATYIFDKHWERFYQQARGFFPRYIQEAIHELKW